MVSRHDTLTEEENDPDNVICIAEIQDVLEHLKSNTINETIWQ